jgi:ABC-type transport system involved in cytochrome c biogenesis permease subunit
MSVDLDTWIAVSRAACLAGVIVASLAWVARSPRVLRAAALVSAVAALSAAAALVRLGSSQEAVPLLLPADMGFAAAAALVVTTACVGWRTMSEGVRARAGFVVLGAALGAIAAGHFADWHSSVTERAPALRSAWLPVHAGAWSLALALTLAAVLARLAGRGRSAALAAFAERAAGTAFAAATLGLISGCVWSQQSWGALWHWDAKGTLALLAWLGLAVHVAPIDAARLRERLRGPALAGSLAAMLFNLFALGYFPGAIHSIHGIFRDPGLLRAEMELDEGLIPGPRDRDFVVFEGDPLPFPPRPR